MAAVHLAEAVLLHHVRHRGALDVIVDAHRALLDTGGDVNFWESGWLRHQLQHWESERDRPEQEGT